MLAAIRSYVRRRLAILCSEEAAKLQGRVDELASDVKYWNDAAKHKAELNDELIFNSELARLRCDELTEGNSELSESLKKANSLADSLREQLNIAIDRDTRATREIAELKQDLAEALHAIDLNEKQLEIANKSNELLSQIHECDIARRKREKAIDVRLTAEAESAARFAGETAEAD